jgi:MSHA biogenesis protein MshJ
MIKARWKELLGRYDALSQRERGLIAAALVGGVLLVGNSIFVDLPLARGKVLSKQLETERGELQMLETQLASLQSMIRDPNDVNRARLPELRAELQTVRGALAEHEKMLVTPQDIPALLERLLARHASLRLMALNTLPTVPANRPEILEKVAGKEAKPELPVTEEGLEVWKHGVEIRLQGSFADLTAYLLDLERLPQRLLWGEVRLTADYPKSELQVKIFTYSLDQAWLKL